MSSSATSIVLADPVCGKPVDSASMHRHVHGGALFCFCGEACQARFAAHPSRLAFIALSGGLRGAKVDVEVETPGPGIDPPGIAPTAPAPLDEAKSTAATSRNGRQASRAAGPFQVLRAWRERRLAARCCRRLLGLYETVAAEHPQLIGSSLYLEVVAMHNGCDASAAQDVLRDAEQSYAIWPVERELNFRDVVHYLAVSEIFAADSASPWAQANVKRIVDGSIPHRL